MNWLTARRNILSPRTTGRRITSMRAFGKWAGWGSDLFADYSAPTPLRGDPHPLPEGIEGVKRMISVCNSDKHAALIALCGMCGLRVAEALDVMPSDFDLSEEQPRLVVRGKGDKMRVVPVSSAAWEVLATPVGKAYVTGTHVVGLKDRFARALITDLGVRAKLKRHVASHDLRATFATAVYDRTLDKRLVQILLGHANGNTTEQYVGRTEQQLKDGVEL